MPRRRKRHEGRRDQAGMTGTARRGGRAHAHPARSSAIWDNPISSRNRCPPVWLPRLTAARDRTNRSFARVIPTYSSRRASSISASAPPSPTAADPAAARPRRPRRTRARTRAPSSSAASAGSRARVDVHPVASRGQRNALEEVVDLLVERPIRRTCAEEPTQPRHRRRVALVRRLLRRGSFTISFVPPSHSITSSTSGAISSVPRSRSYISRQRAVPA